MAYTPEAAAAYAEIIVSPGYREALNTAYQDSPDKYQDQQELAQGIMLGALGLRQPLGERLWEMRRTAALAQTGLGPFNACLQHVGGESTPSNLTQEDLGSAPPEIVQTNSGILGLKRIHTDPFEFFESALTLIDARKAESPRKSVNNIGPGNYTTALKFFTDLYHDTSASRLDLGDTVDLVSRCMNGFEAITRTDKPNFIEMTNLYAAIRGLPVGTFDEKFTPMILKHSLEQLPTFHSATLPLLMTALGKLDLADAGDTAGALFDLAMRKSQSFETSQDMRNALRVMVNLPKSPVSDTAFETFLLMRNNLENVLDMEGLDEVNERLWRVARLVIGDPELIDKAGEMAKTCAQRSALLYKQVKHLGEVTKTRLDELQLTARRTGQHYLKIVQLSDRLIQSPRS
jgi:hypothetical protein